MADTKDFGLDPIPFDDSEASSPSPASSVKPPQDDMFAHPVGREHSAAASPKIQPFGSTGSLKAKEAPQRPITQSGSGASRVRTFHAKLNDGAMAFLDLQINEWLDAHPDYVVKFATTTVGVVEGKRVEQHLIINVWY